MASPALSFLHKLLQPLWPTFRELFVLTVFINLLALAVPVFVMQVYDRVVFHAGRQTLMGLVIGVGVVLLFDWVLRRARGRIMQTVALRLDVGVGRDLFEKIVSLPLAALEGRGTAHWHSLFRDVDVVRNTLSGGAVLMWFDLPFALLFLAVATYIATPVAWVLAVAMPLFCLLAWRSTRATSAASGAERGSGLAREELLAELIRGRTTVKALALESAIRPMWEERHAECIRRAVVRGSRADDHATIGTTLTLLTTVAMTSVGALAIIDQEMSVGALVAANMLSGRLLGVFGQLVGNCRIYAGFMQSVRHLAETLALPGERRASGLSLDPPEGAFTLDGVTFAYPGGPHPIFRGVSARIGPAGVWGIVGGNGSGKSTLLKLLQGLYRPSAGRILLDGADVGQFTRAELARWIGYVPQDCVLLSGSIAANIAQRMPDATDEEIRRAAVLAGVHEAIVDLPDGYATDVGEAGRRLSRGQRQRVTVARALVGDPPVLLLDEPTAGLDTVGTDRVCDLLVDLGRRRTVFVATHDARLLRRCRRIVMIERGELRLGQPAEDTARRNDDPARTPGRTWSPSFSPPPVIDAAE